MVKGRQVAEAVLRQIAISLLDDEFFCLRHLENQRLETRRIHRVLFQAELLARSFEQFLGFALPDCVTDLRQECWFDPGEQLPVETEPAALLETIGRWTTGYRAGIWGLSVNLVPAPLFNKVCDGSGSKATVLSCGLVSLLARVPEVGHAPNGEYANHPVTVNTTIIVRTKRILVLRSNVD